MRCVCAFINYVCIVGDSVAVEQKVNRFKGLDHTFGTSRECQFIEKLMSVSELGR